MRENQKISKSVKESTGALVNRKKAVERDPSKLGLSPSFNRSTPNIAIIGRHQTTDEQHRFQTAIDALLMEMVRQQLSRRSNI